MVNQKSIYLSPIPTNNFIPGDTYNIHIQKDKENGSGYIITADYDYTKDKEVDLFIRLSNRNSIERYFRKVVK